MAAKISICLYSDHATNLPAKLNFAQKNLCSVVITPIVNPLFKREFEDEAVAEKHLRFSRSDLILEPVDWLNKIVAKISDHIDCDSPDENIRKHSEKILKQEITYAQHLSSQGFMLINLRGTNTLNLARIISAEAQGIMLAEVPMIDPKSQVSSLRQCSELVNWDGEDTWQWWNKFRTYADYSPKIKIALEVSMDLPTEKELLRWLGEPVEVLIIPSNIFIYNAKNYPVLSRAHKAVVLQFLRIRCSLAIKVHADEYPNLINYVQYLEFLVTENNKNPDPMAGYDDLLEIPLQPLYDNLDSYTYEVFEKDPVKYIFYQRAIERALIDKISENEIPHKKAIIMVVGAGRGPLVRSAINASINTKRKVKILAIEKNPNAVISLISLKAELWSDKDVTIIPTDMRDFNPPEKADILVSELLGSFGDNELSPECLDGAQKHLKEDGVSIPCQSTSYISPVMSQKLLNVIRELRSRYHRQKITNYDVQSESPYVVYLKNAYHIADTKPVFTFEHPNRDKIIDNSRYIKLKFEIEQDCVLNGFAGYFDTVLYKDIVLSIHPETHSTGLSSWFSMFFPIAEPQQLRAGDVLEVNFWRCVATNKVWYEWNTTAPNITHIHNFKGHASPIYK